MIADDVYEWTQPLSGISDRSITLAKRRSAARAAEAVTVAIGALRDVSDEATRVLPDPADQHQVAAAYFDRLVRADFSGPVSRALESGDPGSAQLFTALAAFIAAAPADVVRDSTALTRLVLQPPIARWEDVPRSARSAVLSMVRALPGSGAEVAGRIGWSRGTRPAVRLARALPGTLGTGAASAALVLVGLARRTRAKLRTARHPA